MVIGERFAWAHLPKTGGDATAKMLTAVPGLATFADPLDSDDKHLPFFARQQEIAGRLLVMNIRRLPVWTLSGAHHRAAHGLSPAYVPLPLETRDEMTSKTDADDLLRWMTDHGRFVVDRWLRAEALERDVLSLLSDLGASTIRNRRRVKSVGRVNQGGYDRTKPAFTTEQVRRLYDLNPTWAAIERGVYGSLAFENESAGEHSDLER